MELNATCFLFVDTQIADESFLEDINNILSSGEVPNLYKADEFEEVRCFYTHYQLILAFLSPDDAAVAPPLQLLPRWKNCSSWAFFPPRTLVGRAALKPTPRVPRCSLRPGCCPGNLRPLTVAPALTRSRRSS